MKFLKSLVLLILITVVYLPSYASDTPPSSPTKVDVTAFITDIQNLDELNEEVQVDAIFQYKWSDPRLAFDAKKEGAEYKLFQGSFQLDETFEGWRPQITIINEIGTPQIKDAQIRVYSDGLVILKEQRTLSLETPMQLEKFPFDKQTLKAYMIPFGFDNSEVQLAINPNYKTLVKDYVKNNPEVNVSEWDFKDFSLSTSHPIKQYYGKPAKVSMLTLKISLDRKPANIVWKVLFPLTLLVLAMWAIFWISPEALSDRLNISFIGILSVIAYQFVVEGDMPRIDYFTFTDGFMLLSFAILFSTIIESLSVYWLIRINKNLTAKFLDVFFRIAFPIVYIMLIALLYMIYV